MTNKELEEDFFQCPNGHLNEIVPGAEQQCDRCGWRESDPDGSDSHMTVEEVFGMDPEVAFSNVYDSDGEFG